MKAVQVTELGAPIDVVKVRDVDVPEPGAGEVRVAVRAASVNYGDIARARGGVASVQATPPFTLGMDVCGVVEAAGDGAEHAVGRRVVATTKMSLGGMAERSICPASGVFDAPPELDDLHASAFFLPFHTSCLALHRRARLAAGETLLVVGGASSVGTAAIQLGVALGATVLAAAGGAEKGAHCRAVGAAHTIDYSSDDVFERVTELTGGRGADVVLDLVGGDLTETLWTCVAREGRYLPVGFNGESTGGLSGRPMRKVSTGNFSVIGVMMSYGGSNPAMRKLGINGFDRAVGEEVHQTLRDMISAGRLKPSIGRTIGMHDVAQALDDHEARRTAGRTVVQIDAP